MGDLLGLLRYKLFTEASHLGGRLHEPELAVNPGYKKHVHMDPGCLLSEG